MRRFSLVALLSTMAVALPSAAWACGPSCRTGFEDVFCFALYTAFATVATPIGIGVSAFVLVAWFHNKIGWLRIPFYALLTAPLGALTLAFAMSCLQELGLFDDEFMLAASVTQAVVSQVALAVWLAMRRTRKLEQAQHEDDWVEEDGV